MMNKLTLFKSKIAITQSLIMSLVCCLIFQVLDSHQVQAEKIETMQKRLEQDKTVRRQKLMRSGRMILSAGLGSSLGDTYRRSHPIGISGTYYLSDEFGIGASAFYA